METVHESGPGGTSIQVRKSAFCEQHTPIDRKPTLWIMGHSIKQGQTVHKLQIATFLAIYIYIYTIHYTYIYRHMYEMMMWKWWNSGWCQAASKVMRLIVSDRPTYLLPKSFIVLHFSAKNWVYIRDK